VEFLGHADSKTTQIYAHYAPSEHEVQMVNEASTMHDVSMQDLPDLLISRGRYSASQEEIRSLTGLSHAAITSGLQRLRRQRRSSPRHGDCMS
jgi:hypothetical protein